MCIRGARLAYTQAPLDLSCSDGALGASPEPPPPSSSGSVSHQSTISARRAQEALPFLCDRDYEADLDFLPKQEARDAPRHSWLKIQPVLSARHRRSLVSWMQRVRSSHGCVH